MREIFRRWVPFTLTNMITFIIEIQSMVFVGQLNDTKALAAVGLSVCFKNVIADSWMFGMNTGLETLAS